MALLFQMVDIPRRPRLKRMRVADAGQSGGFKVIQFICPHCRYYSGWIVDSRSISENKRGLPCPCCNGGKP